MIRMEIACSMVLAFMLIMYFSSPRKNTRIHCVFSALLVLSAINLLFDLITIYTVNHLDTIPLSLNNFVHKMFIGTMVGTFYLIYRYITLLVEAESGYHLKMFAVGAIILIVALLGVVVLPIRYVVTPKGNYSFGPAAYVIYIAIGIYLFLTFVVLARGWKKVQPKEKHAIMISLTIEVFISIYQALNPLALISGMGITLEVLSLYLIMENPDIALATQIQEEKKKVEEANAAKSIFLSNISHEIRTPMNAIVGMTEIILRTDMTQEQKEYLSNIKSSGNALVAIINDLLDISKIEAGKMELVENVYDLKSVLSDIRMIIMNRIGSKPIELLYEIDDDLPDQLLGDEIRIRQVIINLMNNAVKFTQKGYVKLEVKIRECTEDEIHIHFSVSDTGQGIRKEDTKRLFEAFEQVDIKKNQGKEGTGLGLAISSQLIEMMGGKLEVNSEYGVGSEFYFTIPQKKVLSDERDIERHQENVMNFVAPDARILIVDDNEINLAVATGLMEPLQMQIDTAMNGKEAIDMIQKNKYDLVFMDHMMPDMNGVEATKYLRQMQDEYYQKVPVIALTADAIRESQKLFADVGMNDFTTKPIDMLQICQVLRKWLPKNLVIKTQKSPFERE